MNVDVITLGGFTLGFQVQLVAIEGKSIADIHSALGVTLTGTHEEIPESPVVGTQLKNGNYVVYLNDEITPDPTLLGELSRGTNVLSCYVNETVMNSSTSRWRDGNEDWSVLHDSQVGIDDLQIIGLPPSELNSIRQRLVDEQNKCDDADYIFDIPIELFVALGGMRYDEDPDSTVGTNEPWAVLQRMQG